jgi:hypothetical protein
MSVWGRTQETIERTAREIREMGREGIANEVLYFAPSRER